jgi:hypothetical protein
MFCPRWSWRLILAGIFAMSAAFLVGCPDPAIRNSIPAATQATIKVSNSVETASSHVASAATHAATAQEQVRETIPLVVSIPVATRKLTVADTEIGDTRVELGATQAALTTAKAENAKLQTLLKSAGDERNQLSGQITEANERADKYEKKYDDAWVGGAAKRWAWFVGSGISIIVIIAGILNVKYDLFVIPFQIAGRILRWIVKAIAGLFVSAWKAMFGAKETTPKVEEEIVKVLAKMEVKP